MIKYLAKIGRFGTVVLLSLSATLLSVAVTLIAVRLLINAGVAVNFDLAIKLSIIVPLLVTPVISWPIIGIMLSSYRSELEMRDLASHDSLTGLLSRHAFFESSNNYLSLAQREQKYFSVAIVDLDHFKSVNDRYGHAAGDAVLKLFADVVNSVSRRSDIIGRLGGEEFALLLPSTNESEAIEFSQRLHQAIDKAVLKFKKDMIQYTVSIGLCSYEPGSDDSVDDLLAKADIALYRAKNEGRNRSAVFHTQIEQASAS